MAVVVRQGAAELFQQFTLTTPQVDRGFDCHTAHQITRTAATHRRNAFAANAELLAGLSAFRDLQFDPTIEGRNLQLATQRSINKACLLYTSDAADE